MKAINPATEEVIREYEEHSSDQVEEKLARAAKAFADWRETPFERRSEWLRRVGDLMRSRRGELAKTITQEMGKPIAAAEAEIDKCAMAGAFFSEHAAQMLTPEMVASDAKKSFVRYDPLGPVLAIMPWNFPYWQVFRFAAPTLMAGNVAVLKHASNVPGCALAIEKLFVDAGFPDGVWTNLFLSNPRSEEVIGHHAIRAVTLTGSDRAGRAVAAAAGKVLKKSVLELGGSDPFIVLPDVNIGDVAKVAAAARCINTGQSCIAAKRFIIHGSIAREFQDAFVAAMKEMRIGDPTDRSNDLGPLARLDLLENLHQQVRQSVAQGAKLLLGGERLPRRGYFYPATVLSDVVPGMTAFEEETFGPVAAMIEARDMDHMVELANRSRYGLGASIWTRDLELAERLAARIESGCVFVNGQVKSDPRLPFGGTKDSGFGRELSTVGIREFTNLKTVWMADGT